MLRETLRKTTAVSKYKKLLTISVSPNLSVVTSEHLHHCPF